MKSSNVSTHSRPKAAGKASAGVAACKSFQLTAARRRLAVTPRTSAPMMILVSTHSRPKAAGKPTFARASLILFQLTAARRRLARLHPLQGFFTEFQLTAARRRLDADLFGNVLNKTFQLTAARRRLVGRAAGWWRLVCFNSQPPEGGWLVFKLAHKMVMQFQLTAARRRLASTRVTAHAETCFNSQPPEGGWPASCAAISRSIVSTHSRPKAAGHQTALPCPA